MRTEDWKAVCLREDDAMQRCIEVLESSGLRIVLVLDRDEKLTGTVTDGDIRRGLLRHQGMDTRLDAIMRREPKTIDTETSHEDAKHMMERFGIQHIPRLDPEGRVCGLETYFSREDSEKLDYPVFILAGGFGKRLHPLTESTPKPMIPVGTRPILHDILDRLIDSGFQNFHISINYLADAIKEYFQDGSQWDVNIQYVCEDEPLGTAGSLSLLQLDCDPQPVLVMNGDLLIRVNFQKLIDYHLEQGGDATVAVREHDMEVPFGVVELDGADLVGIREKPVYRNFVNAGVYVFNSACLQSLPRNQHTDMPDFLESLLAEGKRIKIFPIHETWLDIGSKSELEKANNLFADQH